MAKRILALVMVLVLSMSLLSVEVFATVVVNTPTVSGNSVTVTWNAVTSATRYTVRLDSVGSAGTAVNPSGNLTHTFNNVAAGNYTITVTAYNGNTPIDSGTSSTFTVNTVVSSGKLTITGTSTSTTVSWTKASDIAAGTGYHVEYTYVDGSNTTKGGSFDPALNNGVPETSATINIPYADMRSVTVTYRDTNNLSKTLGTWTSNGNNNNVGNSGGVYFSGTTLHWTANKSYNYTITCLVNGTTTIDVGTTNVGANYADLSSAITYYRNIYGANATLVFYVYQGTAASTGSLVGYATYGSSTGSVGAGLTVTLSGNNANVSWAPVSNAYSYLVSFTQGTTSRTVPLATSQTSIELVYTSGLTIQVQYNTSANGTYYTIGTASITATGNISYGNSYTGGNGNGGTTTNGTVSNNGAYLSVGSTSTTVSWNAVAGAAWYSVVYKLNESSEYKTVDSASTSATISVGYSNCGTGFVVNVYPRSTNGQIVGSALSATYTSNANTSTGSGTSATTSSIKGITLTEKNSTTTTVSWNAVSGANYYLVSYGRLDSYSFIDYPTNATSMDIPLGRASSFQVYVYSVTASGYSSVGQAIHIGGDPYTASSNNTSSSDKTSAADDNTSVYVTGFKGTTGDKKVTLSWNAAKGATSYDVYWKRSSNSEWKKAGTTSKRAVNITGLNNGVSYDFKVVANSRDSGILTGISPSASGSSTKTAPDPAGAGTTTSTVPVITSATGGKGTITLSWDGIKNGKEYQVWIAKSGSTEYNLAQGGITGTSATISGLSAGTYKVRVKGTTDGTYKKFTDGGGSEYRSVTVN